MNTINGLPWDANNPRGKISNLEFHYQQAMYRHNLGIFHLSQICATLLLSTVEYIPAPQQLPLVLANVLLVANYVR